MLNLSAQNIRLNGEASNKKQAIELVAQGLVMNGNVAEGYLEGMLTRENQTTTFLGNGIAIPHGTIDTRHLVKQTGVQVYQFPKGIEWGEGNIAYIVIGIAAKSDEHLTLLRQLTTILGDEQIAETLAKTQNLEQFIALLSGKRSLPITDLDLISTDLKSNSLLTLSAINAEKLQEKGYVNQTFIHEVIKNPPLHLGNNLYLIDSVNGNLANGIAVARNTQGKTLISVAMVDESLAKPFSELTKIAVRQKLTIAPAEQILAFFNATFQAEQSAESQQAVSSEQHFANNENELEAIFTIHNAHGLHARPSAVLVNEVKKYNASIQLQNLDRNSPLVSAKSLMKVVALGVQKGHRLRFVATGEEAKQALEGIGLAIEQGLGE